MSSRRNRVLSAWAVHAFTLTGVIWATLALLALFALIALFSLKARWRAIWPTLHGEAVSVRV